MNYFWDFLIGNGSGNRKWLTVVLRPAVCFTISLVREQDSESNYLSRSETLPTWSQAGRARPICNACPQRPRRLESRAELDRLFSASTHHVPLGTGVARRQALGDKPASSVYCSAEIRDSCSRIVRDSKG